MADMKAFINSDSFTFLIGTERKRFTVYEAAITSLSEPLTKMMNNGMMQESIERKSVFEAIEPDIFALFVEFAYTGLYRARPKILRSKTQCYCANCGSFGCDRESSMFPFDSSACMEQNTRMPMKTPRYCIECCRRRASAHGAWTCENCQAEAMDFVRGKPLVTTKEQTARSETAKRQLEWAQYPVDNMTHDWFRSQHLMSQRPPVASSDNLCDHARLYIFGNVYMIEPLKNLSLHMLHRDLEKFELMYNNVTEVVELIDITYRNTASASTYTDGVGTGLRNLVLTYAVCKCDLLMESKVFQEHIAEGGEFVLELFMRR